MWFLPHKLCFEEIISLSIFATLYFQEVHAMKKYILCLLTVILFVGCEKKSPVRIRLDGLAQGTFYSIVYMSENSIDYKQEIDSLLQMIDKSVSLWDTNSILYRVNNNKEVPLDNIFIENFQKSQYLSRLTDGAFDITVGNLVNAWGFGNASASNPDARQIEALLQLTGYEKVWIENNALKKQSPDIRIDFNAIAQGFTSDFIAAFLESKNIGNFIVNVGGEVIAKGYKEGKQPWVCGIETPAKDSIAPIALQTKVALRNKALVTSGSYRKYRIVDGVRFSHSIDPRTGYPVRHRLLSATVLADEAWEADGLATAFMVMGLDSAKVFLEKHPKYDAFFVFTDHNDSLKTFATQGMQQIMLH